MMVSPTRNVPALGRPAARAGTLRTRTALWSLLALFVAGCGPEGEGDRALPTLTRATPASASPAPAAPVTAAAHPDGEVSAPVRLATLLPTPRIELATPFLGAEIRIEPRSIVSVAVEAVGSPVEDGRIDGEALAFEEGPLEIVIPAGTVLALRLDHRIALGESRVGDRFTARLEDDLLDPDGMVLLPVGARVRGRLVRPESGPGLALEVRQLVVEDRTHPLEARIVEVDERGSHARERPSVARTATKGAIAGGILGRLLGRSAESAVKGALVGAAVGAAAGVLADDGGVLGPETRILIELEEELLLG